MNHIKTLAAAIIISLALVALAACSEQPAPQPRRPQHASARPHRSTRADLHTHAADRSDRAPGAKSAA